MSGGLYAAPFHSCKYRWLRARDLSQQVAPLAAVHRGKAAEKGRFTKPPAFNHSPEVPLSVGPT